MISLKDLKLMNYTKIDCLKELQQDTTRNELVKQILKDDEWINKIKREDAFIIFKDIGIDEEKFEETYKDLLYENKVKNKVSENLLKEDKEANQNEEQIVVTKESFIKKILNKIQSFFKKLSKNIKR